MCAIVGALVWGVGTMSEHIVVNDILHRLWKRSHGRGRDGRGYIWMHTEIGAHRDTKRDDGTFVTAPHFDGYGDGAMIGNLRAEPTTEFVKDKQVYDQQPYICGHWAIVHNGTIANDKELRTHDLPTKIDSAAIAEQLAYESEEPKFSTFVNAIKKLKGSYAILATHQDAADRMFVACNYRPVWYIRTPNGYFFGSSRGALAVNRDYVPQMLPPYTAALFSHNGVEMESLHDEQDSGKALVVCSGGLDSVVAATYAQRVLKKEIHLIHFLYGSRAEGPEVKAVSRVAEELGCPLTLFPLPVYSKGDSPLLDPDSPVAGGEEGAEFAHEWVPARNLLLLSVATAFAEARGIDTIILGNNLEEAGAYPDNEPEFIARFNDMLPFAVGDGKRVQVVMPVGNMMKHEIVHLGNEIEAPMHLTWSCYRAGALHCGKCGPCFMRRKAHEIAHVDETIEYAE